MERQGKVVILGLPQAIEQNAHVKKILEENYGKDIKVRKVHKQIWAHCLKILNIKLMKDVHKFYKKLSKVVRVLNTMKKIDKAETCVYSVLSSDWFKRC